MDNTIQEQEAGRRPFFSERYILMGVGALLAVLIVVGVINDATAEANPFVQQQSFAMLALLAFVGGMVSFLAPCTLPILPAYFAFASQSGRSQIAANTVVFMLGVATVFSLFGASASALGGLMRQNQDLILLLGGALVVLFGTMSLLGKGFTGVTEQEGQDGSVGQEVTSFGGTFVFGMTFAAGWSSCIGPILGVMLTMAATTTSVLRGGILLFIFALGLGVPLILVSTFIGRASRNSLIWRVLRGKGWFVTVPSLVISVLWAVPIWLISMGVVTYGERHFVALDGRELTLGLSLALLAFVAAASVIIGTMLGRKQTETELHIHTTSLFSGLLFLAMGWFMLNGQLEQIAAWAIQLASESEWYQELEFMLFEMFQ